jgi:AraC family ethanolamine operon transcriptional activator
MDTNHHRSTVRLSTEDVSVKTEFSAVAGWQAEYQQTGKGSFEGWIDICTQNEVIITRQFSNRAWIGRGTPPEDYISFLIPVAGGERSVFQGRTLGDTDLFMMCPGSEGSLAVSDNSYLLGINIPKDRLRSLTQLNQNSLSQPIDRLIGETRVIRFPERAYLDLIHAVKQIHLHSRNNNPVGASPMVLGELEELLIAGLCIGFDDQLAIDPDARARQNHVRHYHRALDYIHVHLTEPLGWETLCHQVGVSRRSLEYAFRNVSGVTPGQYIKLRRLAAARKMLVEADPAQTTVTSIALKYGFHHLGSFSIDYKSLYGESPSQTLQSRKKPTFLYSAK